MSQHWNNLPFVAAAIFWLVERTCFQDVSEKETSWKCVTYSRRARETIIISPLFPFSCAFVAAAASGTTRIIGPPLSRGDGVGVDTSLAFILLFRTLSALQQCARNENAAAPRRVPPTRARADCPEARFFMRTCDDVGPRITRTRSEGIRIARTYTYECMRARARANAHIGTIISHHASAYIIPATESTPAAVGFACCLPLSRQRSRFNGSDAFNGF